MAQDRGKSKKGGNSKPPLDFSTIKIQKVTPLTRNSVLEINPSLYSAAIILRMAHKYGGGGPSTRGSHALSLAFECPRKWYYARHLKLRGKEGTYYMDRGTVRHVTLAYYYSPKCAKPPEWYLECPDFERALTEHSEGNPEWVRIEKEFLAQYERYERNDPWTPVYVEEEFKAPLSLIYPKTPDEPAIELTKPGPPDSLTGEPTTLTLALPPLRDEEATCRPDLIIEKNGGLYIIDHKTEAGDYKTQKLKIFKEESDDIAVYEWQAFVNLAVCRANGMDIQGFIFNRVKRDIPFDFNRQMFKVYEDLYDSVPKTIYESIKKEREYRVRAFLGEDKWEPRPSECVVKSDYLGRELNKRCAYYQLCHVDNPATRKLRILNNYEVG